jgi:hypothetical protein
MQPRVDIVRPSTPIGSAATSGSHSSGALARTLLNREEPMRLFTSVTSVTPVTFAIAFATLAAGCVGEVGGPRKSRDTDPTDPTPSSPDGSCAKVEKDVTIRAMADMQSLPRTGCYDIYGKLTLQGAAITSMLALEGLNSVNELILDHTGLTRIDSKRPVGIYGRLAVLGNQKLTNLKQLAFETAATGVMIDGNPVLTSLDPLVLTERKLDEVNGDLEITGNPALTAISLPNLTKITGSLTLAGNTAVRTIDVARLGTTGHVEIADHPQLTSLTGFAATAINGDFAIRNNQVLSQLGTMSSLYRVTGNLTIDNNSALGSLSAFTTTVKFVDKALTITNNASLTDVGALKHLQLVQAITITNNRNLVNCRAVEVDQCTLHPTTAVISNNGTTNCSWQCN